MLLMNYAAAEQREVWAAFQAAHPIAVGAGTPWSQLFDPIQVPQTEFWAVTFAGGQIVMSDIDITLTAISCTVVSGQVTSEPTSIQTTAANYGIVNNPRYMAIPAFINSDYTGPSISWTFGVSLQGVELSPGDRILFTASGQNTSGGARNIISSRASVRARAFKLVSEQAVVSLPSQRWDHQLDQRLVRTRG